MLEVLGIMTVVCLAVMFGDYGVRYLAHWAGKTGCYTGKMLPRTDYQQAMNEVYSGMTVFQRDEFISDHYEDCPRCSADDLDIATRYAQVRNPDRLTDEQLQRKIRDDNWNRYQTMIRLVAVCVRTSERRP